MDRSRELHKDDPRRERKYWCIECKKEHGPTSEHPICDLCPPGFLHKPAPKDLYFDFKGWRFTAPFYCMSCGKAICHRQWAFSRICGACDSGTSRTARMLPHGHVFAGPHSLVDASAEHCFAANEFIEPKERDMYPLRSPQRPVFPPRPKPPFKPPRKPTRPLK